MLLEIRRLSWYSINSLSKEMVPPPLPVFLQGEVVKGFGRGSKELGCPTANYSLEVIQTLPQDLKPGVYFGWGQVDSGPILKMVANIGWCPYYNNKEMSVETHLIHKFDKDFYGSNLRICLVGFLRDEKNFSSLEELKQAIKLDIENAESKLSQPFAIELKSHEFFQKPLD